MQKSKFFQLVAVSAFGVFLFFKPVSATEFWDYFIWGMPDHQDVRPYLEEAKIPHNSQWADDEWEPQDWVDSRGGNPMAVINGFYDAGIITDQYFDDEKPVLEVGQTFLDLGSKDKRRVVAFVDEVFGVTKFSEAGTIFIYFHEDDLPIGEFNKGGLQLQ